MSQASPLLLGSSCNTPSHFPGRKATRGAGAKGQLKHTSILLLPGGGKELEKAGWGTPSLKKVNKKLPVVTSGF